MVHPHVLLRDHDIFGEGTVTLDTNRARANAHVAATRATVTANTAHHVALARNAIAHTHVHDVLANLGDFAVELVAGRKRNGIAHVLGRSVPLEDMEVGAADTGAHDTHFDIVRADLWLRDVNDFEPLLGGSLAKGFHKNLSVR